MTEGAGIQTNLKLSTLMLHTGGVEMLDRCRDWYIKLGLKEAPPHTPGESYWFDCGNVVLGLHTSEDAQVRGEATLYLDVLNCDEAYARLRAEGFEFSAPPATKSFGGRVCYLNDPVGNTVGLVAPA